MNETTHNCDTEMESLIDRLVGGDLDETARERLLAWLETDPCRWRLCGLAFLEAQAWSQSLAAWPQSSAAPRAAGEIPQITPAVDAQEHLPASGVLPRRTRVPYRQFLVAASILLAFGTGLAVRDRIVSRQPTFVAQGRGDRNAENRADESPAALPGETHETGPVLASVDIEAGGASLRHASVRIPVVPADPAAGSAAPGAEIPEYVRQQCERRGFKPSVERRYLFARLPDGRQVVVPVDQLQLNPIPLTIN